MLKASCSSPVKHRTQAPLRRAQMQEMQLNSCGSRKNSNPKHRALSTTHTATLQLGASRAPSARRSKAGQHTRLRVSHTPQAPLSTCCGRTCQTRRSGPARASAAGSAPRRSPHPPPTAPAAAAAGPRGRLHSAGGPQDVVRLTGDRPEACRMHRASAGSAAAALGTWGCWRSTPGT